MKKDLRPNKNDLRVWTKVNNEETKMYNVQTIVDAKKLLNVLLEEFTRSNLKLSADAFRCGLIVFDGEIWVDWITSDDQNILDISLKDLEAMQELMDRQEEYLQLADEVVKRPDIKGTVYTKIGAKTTVCCLTLLNGFEIIGTSSCVDPKEYNKELGEHLALKRAMEQVYLLDSHYKHAERFVFDKMFKEGGLLNPHGMMPSACARIARASDRPTDGRVRPKPDGGVSPTIVVNVSSPSDNPEMARAVAREIANKYIQGDMIFGKGRL